MNENGIIKKNNVKKNTKGNNSNAKKKTQTLANQNADNRLIQGKISSEVLCHAAKCL